MYSTMATRSEGFDPRDDVPVVALRHMLHGQTWLLSHLPAFAGTDATRRAIVLSGDTISERHLELVPSGGRLQVRSVGKNRLRYRAASQLDIELPAGEWIALSRDCQLLLMSAAMLTEVRAAEFFLGIDRPPAVSRLLSLATDDRPVLLHGS